MMKSSSKGLTKRITDRTVMIANRLVVFTKCISNAVTTLQGRLA